MLTTKNTEHCTPTTSTMGSPRKDSRPPHPVSATRVRVAKIRESIPPLPLRVPALSDPSRPTLPSIAPPMRESLASIAAASAEEIVASSVRESVRDEVAVPAATRRSIPAPPLTPQHLIDARDELRAVLAEAIDDALAPVHRKLECLELRVDALQLRVSERAHASMPTPFARMASPSASSLNPLDFAPPTLAPNAVRAPFARESAPAPEPAPFDGERRRRHVATVLTVVLVVFYASLFGSVALSYV
jgi:hypothetical protein